VNKKHIAKSFGNASQTYESDAPVQKWTATYLREFVSNLDIKEDADCLEIGCGTGFLTNEMTTLLPKANWTITDLSQDMIEECKSNVAVEADFLVMDGEQPDLDKKFDLIVTSLAIQWFSDLEQGIKGLSGLLKPDGRLVFTTLGKNSFKEWRQNLDSLDLQVGLHNYPSFDEVSDFYFDDAKLSLEVTNRMQPYDNGLAFLRALKAIGAQAPHGEYQPLSAASLRNAIQNLENKHDCSMTYEIFLGSIHKRARQ